MLRAHTAILLTVALLAPSAASANARLPTAASAVRAARAGRHRRDRPARQARGHTAVRRGGPRAPVKSPHPEVRRRAIVAVGRIVDPRGRALLAGLRGETNAELLATVAFATGQLKDADADRVARRPAVERRRRHRQRPSRRHARWERSGRRGAAAQARAALAKYLAAAPATSASAPVVGEALLAIGRFPPAPTSRRSFDGRRRRTSRSAGARRGRCSARAIRRRFSPCCA